MTTRADQRSERAAAYRALYRTARWRAISASQLQKEPHCRRCAARGMRAPAKVCDHVKPHRGDEVAFWAGPFQSLCWGCHSGGKQKEERRGYVIGSNAAGRPLDPSHPWNRKP